MCFELQASLEWRSDRPAPEAPCQAGRFAAVGIDCRDPMDTLGLSAVFRDGSNTYRVGFSSVVGCLSNQFQEGYRIFRRLGSFSE